MAKDTTTRLKIALGTFELEFEGSEAFLLSEVPRFVQAARDLQVSQVSIARSILENWLEESHNTKADIDKLIEGIKADLDSMGEMESLRLQRAMDRLSKMMSTLSNLLKKASDAADDIVQNLK